ncbi:alpha/beta fold hydrolase [Taklimakanibacter deserti]|uniref:alpha/beta fold hydrolase n=1 Tax=Taklimakanibacter deserti TaxID=2267839 RepID=UPI0034D53EA8
MAGSCTRRATLAGAASLMTTAVAAQEVDQTSVQPEESGDHLIVRHRRISVDGIEIFYREAGRKDAPAVLLLHGFPTSSHMFRHLMPALADRYRVVAPDYPGFGFSEFPERGRFAYSFAAYADLMENFAAAVGLRHFALYIQDYGAPIGLRLVLKRPEWIAGLIVQNGNAYEEGLSDGWAPLKAYWRDPTPEKRAALTGWLGPEGVKLQYLAGLSDKDIERVAPENWLIDQYLMQRAGSLDVQLDLFGDYKTNIDLYPKFQAYFREHKPPTLIVWGRHDPFFTMAGAQAFRRDMPDAELHFLDASHFVLETQAPAAIRLVREFLDKTIS